MSEIREFAASLEGRTVHLIRGTKYAGQWTITEAIDNGDGWVQIKGDGCMWFTREADCFDTEAEARTVATSRRKPRGARTPRPLYGDFAMLAAFSGIRTDGTGQRVAR